MHKSIASNAFTITIIIILFCSILIAWIKSEYEKEGKFFNPVCIQVQSGQTIVSVSNMLEEENLIKSPVIFRLGANYTKKASLLKAGSFIIPEKSSMEEIIYLITRGGKNTCGKEILYQIGVSSQKIILRDLNPKTGKYFEILNFDMTKVIKPEPYKNTLKEKGTRYRIIIAEGTSSWRIVEALNLSDFLTGKVTKFPKEGSLAPSSYEVGFGYTREALIERMEETQYKILTAAWEKRDSTSPLKTAEEALVLASIIEKETGLSEERKIVASVFVNRLKKGMKLQTDPAVIYGLTQGKRALGRGLKRSELILNTPFNTYINSGLPPTPIANPGKLAIQAALNPTKTKYLFFVADGSGGHAFAEDLKTHNENVLIWRSLNKKTNKN